MGGQINGEGPQQAETIITPNPLMMSKIYKPSHTVSKYINSIINPCDQKNQHHGQYTPQKGVESPNNQAANDMRKLNVSGILDRNIADHV